MASSTVVHSRREDTQPNDPDATGELQTPSDVATLSLWELLLVQSTGDHERQEMLTNFSAAKGLIGGLSSFERNLSISRTFDVRSFLSASKIKRALLDDASIQPAPRFLSKLYMCRRVSERYRNKFLRWETIKVGMVHGVHENGTLSDTQGIGCAVWLPLRMTKEPFYDRTISSVELDRRLEQQYNEKIQLLFCRDALNHYKTLYHKLTSRGGVITRPVYFAIMKLFFKATFFHLTDLDLHRLIAADFDADCRETSHILHKLQSTDPRRRSSVRLLSQSRRSSSVYDFSRRTSALDGSISVATLEVLNSHDFQRFVASMAFVWMEGTTISELLLFVDALHRLWVPRTDYLDLDFMGRFERKDYTPSQWSLVPAMDAATTDRNLETLVTYEIVKAIFVRFPMYTHAKEDVLERWKKATERLSLPTLRADGTNRTEAGRRKTTRRSKSLCTGDGFPFGILPDVETQRIRHDDDAFDNDVTDIPFETSVNVPAPLGRSAQHGAPGASGSYSKFFGTDASDDGVGQLDFLEDVLDGANVRKGNGHDDIHVVLDSSSAGDSGPPLPITVGLYVPMQQRHPAEAPTLRQVQYLSYHDRPAAVVPSPYDTNSIFVSRVVPGTPVAPTLPSIMRHAYHKHPMQRNGPQQRRLRGEVEFAAQDANPMAVRLREAMRMESRAALSRPSRLAPVLDRARLSNSTIAHPSGDTYDLGVNAMKRDIRRSYSSLL